MELSNTQTWWIYTRLDGRNGECWSTMKIRCIVMRLKIARVTALQGGTMHSVNKHLSTSCVHCCCTISIALGFFRHLPTSSNHRTLRYSAWVKSLPFFSQCRNSLWETFPSPPGRRTRLGTGRHVATLPPLPLSRSLHKTSTSLKVKSEFNLSRFRLTWKGCGRTLHGLENIIDFLGIIESHPFTIDSGILYKRHNPFLKGLGNFSGPWDVRKTRASSSRSK